MSNRRRADPSRETEVGPPSSSVAISLAAAFARVHTFTLRGQAGLDLLATNRPAIDVAVTAPRRFEAELTSVQLGAIAVDSFSATAYRIARTGRHLRAGDPDVVHFCLLRQGRSEIEQDGRLFKQPAGSAVLLRSAAPYRCHVVPGPGATRSHTVTATIPMSALPDRAATVARLTCQPLPRTALLVAATNFLSTVTFGLPEPGSDAANFVEHAIVDLVLAVIAERVSESAGTMSVEASILVRIRDFVLRRLADAELGPRRIAAEFGISTRYLHRLFESEDDTVGSFIRTERLKKAAGELSDSALRHLDLRAIAARSGFAGADQFGRAFRSRYGVSPREYRRDNKAPSGVDRRSVGNG